MQDGKKFDGILITVYHVTSRIHLPIFLDAVRKLKMTNHVFFLLMTGDEGMRRENVGWGHRE